MNHIERAIRYVSKHVNKAQVECAKFYMGIHRTPLSIEDYELESQIYDLMEEYGQDNNLPDGWWSNEIDIDDLLFKLETHKNEEI